MKMEMENEEEERNEYEEIDWGGWNEKWSDPVNIAWNDEMIYEREM